LSLTGNLAAGVISSLIAIVLVEIYQLMRKDLVQRPLRKVFGSSGRRAVLVPKFPGSGPDLLDTHDAIALAHVLSVLNKFRISADVLSSEHVPDQIPADLICIGGWSGNSATAFFMQRYCPGFSTRGDNKEGGSHRTTYYEAGGKVFIDEDDDRWGFIVKLSPAHTGLSGTVLLLWGHDRIGTAAAAFFATQYASKLSKLNQDAFFVAVRSNAKLGYRNVQLAPIDISTSVFAPSKVVSD